MSTRPDGAKTPQDHKASAADELEAILSEDELLDGMPELKAPNRLRVRERNKILTLSIKLNAFRSDDEQQADDADGDDAAAAITMNADDPRMPLLLDVLADIDEFAESIATDPVAYVEWSIGKGYDVFTALLMRYASAVGESSGS